MNILIIPAFFQTKKRITLGSFFIEQAKALKQSGHNVTILYCDTYSVKCMAEWIKYEEENMVTEEGISIYRKKSFCPLKHGIEGHRQAFTRGIIELYEKYVKNEAIDIIHAHCCVWAGYAAMQLSKRINIPYVITEHATLFQLHKNKISNKNNEKIEEAFKNAARVICVSKAFGELLSEYRNNIDVVGNVVNCEFFKPSLNKMQIHDDDFKFLTICYMDEEAQLYKKGIDILLKAWKNTCIEYPFVKLFIGGGGQAQKKVIEWIREFDLQGSVKLLGTLNREQVVEQMQKCDCFVLPSRYETFGVVYIEAMACGKPVIAVENGGPDDFVKSFNGILIKAEQVQELEDSMKQMIENKDKYDAEEIRSFVEKSFSQRSIAQQLEKIYQEVTKK